MHPPHSHKAPTVGHVIKLPPSGPRGGRIEHNQQHFHQGNTASTLCHDSSRPDLPHQSILDAGTTKAHACRGGTSDNCQQEDVALSKEASVGAAQSRNHSVISAVAHAHAWWPTGHEGRHHAPCDASTGGARRSIAAVVLPCRVGRSLGRVLEQPRGIGADPVWCQLERVSRGHGQHHCSALCAQVCEHRRMPRVRAVRLRTLLSSAYRPLKRYNWSDPRTDLCQGPWGSS
jgi:hypothetical protein